jgi:2,4-dienoyl-CoA reductase-like NADH-dependent reductase (Old Yellow Enzyme family)
MASPALFSPLKLGNNQLKHRVVLSPMTRCRSDANAAPTDLVAEYYAQRATDGGLLIAESTFITRTAGSFPGAAGIYNKEQINAWRSVTDAVHAKGGIIFLQIIHVGRVSSSALNEGQQPVSASAVIVKSPNPFGGEYETPRALEVDEIHSIIQDFRQAALNAVEAGFDGVEINSSTRAAIFVPINMVGPLKTEADSLLK